MMRISFVLSLMVVAALVTACPKQTADLELEAARKSIADAQAKRASECAKETYQAAEAAIAEANRLAEAGEIDAAKQKAGEAKALADQAAAASSKGCKEKKEKEEEEEDPNRQANADQNIGNQINMSLGEVMETVYFDYNEASIREDSKAMLSRVAEVMAKTPTVVIEIEGHCDVRGSTEYNLSLGERRARSVEKYLTTQGVSGNQIQIISYGEERPVDLGDSENSHQKNRRAELHKVK